MNRQEIVIESLQDYLQNVSFVQGTVFYSRTTNFLPIYRGQADKSWKIAPSVFRNNQFQNESNYIRELERCAPDEFYGMSRIDKLIKMQHYGLPTRLLDFSSSSLVAMYFACADCLDKDGAVYELHAFPLYHQNFVWISIVLKYIFEFPSALPFDVDAMISELETNSADYPQRGVDNFLNKESIIRILTSPMGIYPQYTNKRIKAQNGLFVLPGMSIDEHTSSGIVFKESVYNTVQDLWPESRKIIVPANKKQAILSSLRTIGISESTIYPELQHLAKDVTDRINGS